MSTMADSLFATAPIGAAVSLPRAGTWLENDYVYDATARDIQQLADAGVVEIVDVRTRERSGESLISDLTFRRLR